MLDFIFGLLSHDLAIDLGTANTLVLIRGKGIAVREPSVVARHKKTKQIIAIGTTAKRMLGKTPATIEAIRPLKDGVIADLDATEAMLSHYIKLVHQTPSRFRGKIPRPKVIVGIPSGVTEVERRAVQEACLAAGARAAYLIEEPMAAAIGIGLPVLEPAGLVVVDIGGGTTELAVISLGGIVLNKCLRIAGDEMDEAIINFLRLKHSLLVGQATAEEVKIQIGSAFSSANMEEEKRTVVRGRDLETGLPKSVRVGASEIREALSPVVNQILLAISDLIEEIPPELTGDVLNRGMVLAGGVSQLPGLDKLIAEKIKMPVWVAEDPMTAVVRGCGRVLEDEELLKKVRVTGGLR
jgi:rod shape-determining protein MreB